jgi:hypothetical protein
VDIGRALLVLGTIGKADGAKTAGLVDAPGARIGLEAPEIERRDAARLRRLDELRSRPAPDAIGPRIKLPQFLAPEAKKRDDAGVVFGNCDGALLQLATYQR